MSNIVNALDKIREARELLGGLQILDTARTAAACRPSSIESEVDKIAVMAAEYECAKASKHAILHAIFDLALNAKSKELKMWAQTGQVYTRDGPNNWRFDPKKMRNERGYSLLHVAVSGSSVKEEKKMEVVELLIEEFGWDPNEIDLMGRTPLHIAVMSGFKTIVSYLLEHGADSEVKDRAGLTPLSLALSLSRPKEEAVQRLLQYVQKGQNSSDRPSVLNPMRQRQQLHFVLLMQAICAPLNATLTVKKNEETCTASDDVGHFCSSGELIEIGGVPYYCRAYDASSRTLTLDRPYRGESQNDVSAIVHQDPRAHPPYIRLKTICANAPGNPFEQSNSIEQQVVQHSQFLDPTSLYEVAMKMGPLTKDDARMMLKAWKDTSMLELKQKSCGSTNPACAYQCSQKQGEAMCVYSMMASGKALAKEKLRRSTYAKVRMF